MGRVRRSAELGKMVGAAEREERCIVAESRAERQRLYRAAKSGKLIAVAKGMYVRPDKWLSLEKREQTLHIMRTMQHTHPHWTFAGPSAALVYGLWVSYDALLPIQIAVGRREDGRDGSLAKRVVISGDAPSIVGGLRVTSFERTVFDCLREMDFAHGLAIADSALRIKGWNLDRLVNAIENMPHRCAGWKRAMQTVRHADARAESGGESMARARMQLLGYALPDLQVKVHDVVDGNVYRGDFGWRLADETLLIGELDGHEKYVNEQMTGGRSVVEVLSDERLRESRINGPRVSVMRFSFSEMMDDRRFREILDAYGVPKGCA